MGEWKDALKNYGEAVKLAPNFSFASANYALVSRPPLPCHLVVGRRVGLGGPYHLAKRI